MKTDKIGYFLILAASAARRATCPRLAVGAVLIKEGRIISTGYNGAPAGFKECLDDGCLMFESVNDRARCVNSIHAEINCLIRAREQGDTIVCTDQPCLNCLKAILSHNPDIEIYYAKPYNDSARDMFLAFHNRGPRSIEGNRGIRIYQIDPSIIAEAKSALSEVEGFFDELLR